LAQRFLGSPSVAEEVWKRIQQTKPAGKSLGPGDLPLSNESKRVLAFARDEADRQSSQPIGPEHLLLGLLLQEKCFAAEILGERGLRFESTREELGRVPHEFLRTPEGPQESPSESKPVPQDIVEVQQTA
jgi:ATP-dependent Clp protease ATP-binding subunit ClpC